jgi:hypothetical protein
MNLTTHDAFLKIGLQGIMEKYLELHEREVGQ